MAKLRAFIAIPIDLREWTRWIEAQNIETSESDVTDHEAALTILETQITDGSLLSRNAGNETVTGTRLFQARVDFSGTAPVTFFGNVGFYGTTPIVKQTGVAVSAAGVHAALVNLGLIS